MKIKMYNKERGVVGGKIPTKNVEVMEGKVIIRMHRSVQIIDACGESR